MPNLKWQEYYKKHKERRKEIMKAYYRRNKDKYLNPIFEHYGQKCVCCGETGREFLNIDHVNNDGKKHKKSLKGNISTAVARDVVRLGFPDKFQILCWNCNYAKALYNGCPHKMNT